jgi:hypothetical protein
MSARIPHSQAGWVDLLIYNHARYNAPIVDCNISVKLSAPMVEQLAHATVRRIDETHANPLAAWIAMGAPDYTTAEQNAALLAASVLQVENLVDIASLSSKDVFTITVPTHGVAAVRVKS